MDVFQHLRDDDKHIEERLVEVTTNYFDWTRDRVFEESKKIFNSIKNHLHQKETLLVNNLKSTEGMAPTLEESNKEREDLDDEIDNLTAIHVDEPGFEESLEKLLAKVKKHRQFCDEIFYPQMQAHLTNEDISQISKQLEQVVLG